VFDKDGNGSLDLVEFIDGMRILFSEKFDCLSKMIFSFYDFNKDGLISKDEVRTILSYIPVNTNNLKTKSTLKYEK
jgi:Ca2+-binding EF-hand superfamily protein